MHPDAATNSDHRKNTVAVESHLSLGSRGINFGNIRIDINGAQVADGFSSLTER
jgi:hypothetical protein